MSSPWISLKHGGSDQDQKGNDQIVGTSLDTLMKKEPANKAEDILQRMNTAFSYKKN